MKLKYKYQKFQADAAKAVVDVFAGQPYLTCSHRIDTGNGENQLALYEEQDSTGWGNHRLIPELNDQRILEQLQKIQRVNQIKPSDRLEGHFNLTIEMETGVGKTYTYIKTMYELNRAYGWSKFIVVVPNIAVREGVYKSFQTTQEHFAEEYGKKIRFFIYNSQRLTEVDRFASDNMISVMIINSQAFNARGKDARRIYMKLDEFRSRRPIDIIAKTNPILIIDEPQSVEGKQTKERLKEFCPMMTLRYSATHKPDSIYNMVYRLDAMEAYNKKLVKKIAVKGITETGSTATNHYLYLEGINLSEHDPTATLQFEVKLKSGTIKKKSRIIKIGNNLYDYSGGLEEYKTGFIVTQIDGRDDSVEFLNGIRIHAGEVIGAVDEEQVRRIQIRETILTHIQRERQLFYQGIKVLSLFFIDEVAKYREYDDAGQPVNGRYAELFEEEYADIISGLQKEAKDDAYLRYLQNIPTEKTHAGYFSIDSKGKMVDGKINKKEATSEDASAYELIMKNKELLLDRDPKRSPVRFIFSHSALREGWDNPNVFQICTLKQSSSEVRKRQEVGRGLRLCVNQDGERMDENVLGNDVHNINVLTVIASESYESFAKALQSEIAETVISRPRAVTAELFIGKVIRDAEGNEQVIDPDTAASIHYDMITNGYIDRKGVLTDKYYADKAEGEVKLTEEAAGFAGEVINIIDSVYDEHKIPFENARKNDITLSVDEDKLAMPEFKALWEKINARSVYVVDFDTNELIQKSVSALDSKLHVSPVYICIETGEMNRIRSKDELISGRAFVRSETESQGLTITANQHVKYDLIGKLVESTGLTRKAIVAILQGIQPDVFAQFRQNPEEFITKAAALINDEKATAIIEHITYDVLNECYETDIFTEPTIRGKLDVNAMKTQKHLYDHIVYDSANERKFAAELETRAEVAVYVKLPDGFYISTPVGRYNPDWAIAFREGKMKHVYFVAETKGSMRSMQMREIEKAKIHCAEKHFKSISGKDIVYDVIDNYQSLLDKLMK